MKRSKGEPDRRTDGSRQEYSGNKKYAHLVLTDNGVVKSVDGVDIELKEGSTLGIVGESGSGKSVTALSVMGLLMGTTGKIEKGEILLDGRDIVHIGNEERRKLRGSKISMIFQEPMTSLNPVMKIGDQIMEAILMHQKVKQERSRRKSH